MKKWTHLASGLALLAATSGHAQADAPKITDAWVKSTVPGATVSAAYMQIQSASTIRLVKAETPAAGLVELHNMSMKDGAMEMKAMDAVEVPAGKSVTLKPGGMHVMMMKLKQPIKAGDKVPLILTFEGADRKPLVVKLDAPARDAMQTHGH